MKFFYWLNLFILCANLIFPHSGFSQKSKIKFGDVTAESFKKNPVTDSTTGAVVLFDIGKSYFTTTGDDIKLVFEHHKRIKILSKAGYDWANGEIELYSSNGSDESISKFDAATYNLENGKVVISELKKDGVFDNKVIDNYMIKKFTMPHVKEGSIIEFKYKIYSPYIFNLRAWSFQESIPVQYSAYTFEVPDFFHFKKEMKGFEPTQINVKQEVKPVFPGHPSQVEIYTIVAENMPAFSEEAFLTSAENYKTAIDFEISSVNPPGGASIALLKDWPQIGGELIQNEHFGDIINKKGQVKEEIELLVANKKTELDKMIAIYNHVRSNFKWNDNNGILASQRLKKTLDDKTGNVADINLLLTLMLKAGNLSASPVILSTRQHGIVLPYFAPMLKKFNYVICQVKIEGKTYLLDATDTWRPYDVLPERCLNGQGRVFYDKASEWVDLKNQENVFHYDMLQLVLDQEGALTGTINSSRKSYAAFVARSSVGKKPKNEYVADIKKARENWDITELNLENLENLGETYTEKYEVKINNMVNMAGDRMYLEPMLVAKMQENPFKMNERKYPVDFAYPIRKTYACTIKLPQGYTLDEKVKPVIVTLPDNAGKFLYEVSEAGGNLQIKSNIIISKVLFLPNEYEYLKEFYNHIIAKHAEQIVLRKL